MRYLFTFVAVVICTVSLFAQNDKNDTYELYKTQNYWTFLKLETTTGRIWQVQFSVNDDNIFQVVLNDLLLATDANLNIGRFKLYQTENIYNFILLDTQTGKVWQVQWSQEPENRMIIPIYEL